MKKYIATILIVLAFIISISVTCYTITNATENSTISEKSSDLSDEDIKKSHDNLKKELIQEINAEFEEKWDKRVESSLDQADKALNGISIFATVISIIFAGVSLFAGIVIWRFSNYKEFKDEMSRMKSDMDNSLKTTNEKLKHIKEVEKKATASIDNIEQKAKSIASRSEEVDNLYVKIVAEKEETKDYKEKLYEIIKQLQIIISKINDVSLTDKLNELLSGLSEEFKEKEVEFKNQNDLKNDNNEVDKLVEEMELLNGDEDGHE